jgi:hypothetical protein
MRLAFAQHDGRGREPAPKRRHGGSGAPLLREAQQRAAGDDGEDDRGLDPVAQQQRDRRGEDQDQHERARELVRQQPEPCRARLALQRIAAMLPQSTRRLACAQACGRAVQRGQQGFGRQRPGGCGHGPAGRLGAGGRPALAFHPFMAVQAIRG